MTTRRFAGWMGGFYLFMSSLLVLFSLFPAGIVHEMVYLATGLWGTTAASNTLESIRFSRMTATVFGVLTLVELTHDLRSDLGPLVLDSSVLSALHLATALTAAYFGYYWTDAVFEAQKEKPQKINRAA